MEQLSGGPLLHALRRIADLPNLPPAVLKTLDWTLRKDIQEIEKVGLGKNKKVEQILIVDVLGHANTERAALVDVKQPPVGEHGVRVAEPEHPAAEHQRVGAGLEHATPLQPALSTPVEPWKS